MHLRGLFVDHLPRREARQRGGDSMRSLVHQMDVGERIGEDLPAGSDLALHRGRDPLRPFREDVPDESVEQVLARAEVVVDARPRQAGAPAHFSQARHVPGVSEDLVSGVEQTPLLIPPVFRNRRRTDTGHRTRLSDSTRARCQNTRDRRADPPPAIVRPSDFVDGASFPSVIWSTLSQWWSTSRSWVTMTVATPC